MPPVALTIAGSDPGGAAGIQADLKTFHAFAVYGASVVTALTAQDTMAVHAIVDVEPSFGGAPLPAVHDAWRARADLGARAARVTGGHLAGPPVDVLFDGAAFHELDGPRIGETPAHGTGCTLSAAITAGLAAGLSVADAVARARRY